MKKNKRERFRFYIYKSENGMLIITCTIDCNDLIDYYDYHDAPSSIDWYPELSELVELRDKIDDIIQEYEDRLM